MTEANINDGDVVIYFPGLILGNGIYVVSVENTLLAYTTYTRAMASLLGQPLPVNSANRIRAGYYLSNLVQYSMA
jgi:hypothetical protein